jgi:hypothetical protein
VPEQRCHTGFFLPLLPAAFNFAVNRADAVIVRAASTIVWTGAKVPVKAPLPIDENSGSAPAE